MIQNQNYTLIIDNCKAMIKVINDALRRMEKDEELAISFIQVGHDLEATRFLKVLDDDLQSLGAKFDIVEPVTVEEMKNMSLSEVLLNVITD